MLLKFLAFSMFLSSLALYIGTLNGALLMHNLILSNVIRAPCTTFYDITPVGRILNRFSKDVETLDSVLPMTLRGWITCFFSVLIDIILISFCVFFFSLTKAVVFKSKIWMVFYGLNLSSRTQYSFNLRLIFLSFFSMFETWYCISRLSFIIRKCISM